MDGTQAPSGEPQKRSPATQASRCGSSEAPIVNALSVDVEDYFHVSAFSSHIPTARWNSMECRVDRNVERILSLLNDSGATATFFTLGWVAERFPQTIRSIADAGHEVASHGYAHGRAIDQSPAAFLADISLAKTIVEDTIGHEVHGYRAPSFSIGASNTWAFDKIVEAGYRYSSSIYPIRHDHYGMPESPRFAHRVRADLLEVPIATVRMFASNWPAGGGGYFRLLPYAISRWSIRRINGHDRQPAMFYFHPWEIDPRQPRINGPGAKARFRHYVNLHRTEPRLGQLLRDFRWSRADRVFLGNDG
jgi:polysaccharide deacetylase family protein (PEP-CTERM system associated)